MTIPAFALHWAKELGGASNSLSRLKGGVNNRVYRCGTPDKSWVIKGYDETAPAIRDRMKAEVDFLNYAGQVAPTYVPKLIKVDTTRRCVVLEHINGEAYARNVRPSKKDIYAAVDFLRKLNANPSIARTAIRIEAAEGFLSISDHVSNVRERLIAMSTGHLPRAFQADAYNILQTIKKQFDSAQTQTIELIQNGIICDTIDPNDRCVSPSDFGFHNAIKTERGVYFLDFEFAGWDDPAKTILDFMLQPKIPIKHKHFALEEALDTAKYNCMKKRYSALGPILYIKWLCIIASVMKPSRLMEKLEVNPTINASTLIARQLTEAKNYMKKSGSMALIFKGEK
jgi:hypothetical protein